LTNSLASLWSLRSSFLARSCIQQHCISSSDANLLNTRSSNPHAKTPIPEKPSKSDLTGVWHKDNLYLGTSNIGKGNSHPTNIDSRIRSIRMMPRSQLFFNKLFFSSLENQWREIIPPTHYRRTTSFLVSSSIGYVF
jgi:hypothetical protein